MENIFNQAPFQCKMDWGERGTREASERGDIIIIIDILSFSSAVVNAVHHESIIYPFPKVGDIEEFGKLVDAQVCLGRAEALEIGMPSLSAPSFGENHKGKRFVLSSRNGATCVKASRQDSNILIGSFLNASAVAIVANKLQKETGLNITVIACGEMWKGKGEEKREFRPSIEDYLGAGAILTLLEGTKSPEARVCISAFESCRENFKELILDSASGRELKAKGFPNDVIFALEFDKFKEVPITTNDEKSQVFFKNYVL